MADRSRLAELRHEAAWRRYRRDPAAFFRECWYIKHPEHGRMLFELRPAQAEGLEHWMSNRYSLTLKARQIGWSTLVAGYAFWCSFFHPDREIILVSRTEREAVDLLRKAKYGYDNLPAWLQARGPQPKVDHQQKMVWANESQIVSMPSAADPARGSTAYLVVVDEWAFLPNAEDAWASIEPVADVGGRIVGLSTANGSGNFFHGLWVAAETGANQFAPMFQPWWANGDRDNDWYAAKKSSMLPWQLAQEFPSTAEEAFIKSGNPVFDLDDLTKFVPLEPLMGSLVELSGAA